MSFQKSVQNILHLADVEQKTTEVTEVSKIDINYSKISTFCYSSCHCFGKNHSSLFVKD